MCPGDPSTGRSDGVKKYVGAPTFPQRSGLLGHSPPAERGISGLLFIFENSAACFLRKLMLKIFLVQLNCEVGARAAGTFGIFGVGCLPPARAGSFFLIYPGG